MISLRNQTRWFRQSLRRRSTRYRYYRYITAALLLFLLLDLLSLLWRFSSQTCLPPTPAPSSPSDMPRIFIASTHWNNEVALRAFWNRAVVALAEHVGPENVYVSVYESGSWDDSKGALRLLDAELEGLGVQRSIVLDESTHKDEIAKVPGGAWWIETPRGKKELRRIPFLAKARNKSLEPMRKLALNGVRFDKVLFLNDVAFTTEDVMTLIDTRGGSYAAACSLDFMHPPKYYDTFALRDSQGYEAVTTSFPYFRSWGSRKAMMSGQPVPVQSCWNGVVVFDAKPFYDPTEPLSFRGIPDSLALHHLEGSECCLVHVDNPLTASRGVWLNPNVRVAYSLPAYKTTHPPSPRCWPSVTEKITGVWHNRFWRWMTFTIHKSWLVRWRVGQWEKQTVDQEHDVGLPCLINEMQVVIQNGWAHV